jgi:precorrin-8X/cobalt-precorrin-8 methylmutase
MRTISPIEIRSYEILRDRVDTSHLPSLTRAVVERVIHSSADLEYLDDLVVSSEADLLAAHRALHIGVPIVADVHMVAAGIPGRPVVCRINDAVATDSLTRSAAGIVAACEQVGPGAIWVIGNAPTALEQLLALDVQPRLIVGLPVGFVGAAESKAALRASGFPAISNISEKGGSAVAAAAINALLYAEPDGVESAADGPVEEGARP